MLRREFTMGLAGFAAGDPAVTAEVSLDLTVRGVEIPCRITRPERAKAVVLLLPGSLFSDVDGNFPAMNLRPHAYADLAAQLAACGVAVMRMAKIGPGTGSRTIDAAAAAPHLQFATRVEVAEAALAMLRAQGISRRVVVAGHSEGAVVGSLLAAGPAGRDIDGVVSLSGPALPIFGVMREQLTGLGMAPEALAAFDQAVAALRAGRPIPPELARAPVLAPLAAMPPASLGYLVSYDRVDPRAAAAAAPQPMLIVQGLADDSVAPHHADDLLAARAGQPTEVRRFPGLTHFYKRASPGLSPMAAMALDGESDPAVAASVADWASRLRPRRG
jgi:fermentation-respiration switch protein FrsA (DUF1100 family)